MCCSTAKLFGMLTVALAKFIHHSHALLNLHLQSYLVYAYENIRGIEI
jgi:hypothetical protein